MLALLALGGLQNLAEPLDDPKLKGALVCAIVMTSDGKVEFERNADIRVMPASNEKLFTCAYALAQRGPDYKSSTKFWFSKFDAKIEANGDPTLASSALVDLHAKYHIGSGHRFFIKQAYKCDRPGTWQLEDVANRYAPAVHAFTVDKGGFELDAGPKGLSFTPHTPVLNRLNFSAGGGPLQLKYNVESGSLEVSGKLPSSNQKVDTLSDPDPSQTALACLSGVKSPIVEELDEAPKDTPTEEIESPPISQLIKDCLQPSDNCLAEHLLFIGSKAKDYGAARRFITEWLHNTVGLDSGYFRVEDGSGLSRKNQTTVRTISKLLYWTTQQKTTQLWQDSLAHMGAGTLAKRLDGVDFVGKTGSLDMVSALSGFVKCKNGDTKIVSVVLNHYGCSPKEATDAIDRFIQNVSK